MVKTRARRLVIADDSAEMRWIVRAAVGDQFADIVEVSDGRELFWTLLRRDFIRNEAEDQLLITDLCMPAYDGLDVAAAWRELSPTAPIIVLTAFPSSAVRKRAAELGAVVVSKPISTVDLRRVIREVNDARDQ